jgi:methylmalonyl-CoA mutase N-terminal domain/subunit
MDETLALPTDESVMIALRTQQIIAEESGVAHVADPLGGSYYVEELTNRVEKETLHYIQKIWDMGGMIRAIERGYPQSEIANSAYHFQRLLETKDKVMVGVNKYQVKEERKPVSTLYIDRSVGDRQVEKLKRLKASRDAQAVKAALLRVEADARSKKNMCPSILEAVKVYATLQEICDTLRGVYGEYREVGHF